MKWNDNAKEYIDRKKIGSINPYNFYIYDLYKTLSRKAILRMQDGANVNVLKTDLWDHTVEKDRDILSYLNELRPNYNYYGIDISEEIVNQANKDKGKINYHFSVGDIRRLNFDDERFDIILDYSTIDHIQEKDLGDVFREYYRTLKPGGKALVVFWQDTIWLRSLSVIYKLISGIPIIENSNLKKFQYYHKPKVMVDFAQENGFIVKKNKFYLGVFLNFFRGPLKNLYKILPKCLFRLSVKMEMSKLSPLYKNFSALCAIELIKPYNIDTVKEFWNEKISKNADPTSGVLWDNNKMWNKFIDFEQKKLLKEYFKGIKNNDLVLDFGCGTGRFIEHFLNRTENIYAIDTSQSAINYCKTKFKNSKVKFENKDINDIYFGNVLFDHIFSITSLQSINKTDEIIRTLQKFHSLLKPKGKIIMIESITKERGDPYILNINDRFFYALLQKLGFSIIRTKNIDVVLLRKLYLKLSEKKYPFFLLFILIIIIGSLEITPLGSFFKKNSWYKLIILEKA